MTSAPSDRFRHRFKNLEDAHRKVSALLKIIPVAQRSSSSLQSAIDLYRKIVAALRLWLSGSSVSSVLLSPPKPPFTPLEAHPRKMHMAWPASLDCLDETELTNVFDYFSCKGPHLRDGIEDILTQLFGNSWNTRCPKGIAGESLGGSWPSQALF